eukprot:GHVN01105692.1.p1 GENE.GHVN01105692.1~~GHVN01105692.1.p1  ORF type:complete len:235 (-),score=7.77 GHVN01105692.1:138-761(-)
MFLSAEFPLCSVMRRNASSCCLSSSGFARGDVGVFASVGDICESPLEEFADNAIGCHYNGNEHALHIAHTVLFSLTIIILSVFEIELFLLILCLGRLFFRHCFYVLDLSIVTTSIVLEIVLRVIHYDVLAQLTGILIIARVWRFVRIGHGIAEATIEMSSQRFYQVVSYNERLEELLNLHGVEVPFSEEMHNLKSMDPWVTESVGGH